MNPNPNQNQHRCSACNEPGHNIRSCIKQLDIAIIEDYGRRILENVHYTSFTPIITKTKLNRLCEKYGLAIQQSDTIKKERLHMIYLLLGRQYIRNMRNERYIVYTPLRYAIYRPSYLPPLQIPPLQIEYPQIQLQYHQIHPLHVEDTNNNQNNNKKKPTIQIVVDTSKFQDKDVSECPVCYEECGNMIMTDCNHSYCQPCISQLINTVNKNTLPCPLCRENIKNVFVFSETSSNLMLHI